MIKFPLDKISTRVYNKRNYTLEEELNFIILQGNEGEEYNSVGLAESRCLVKAGNTH